jgi:hypothetical protein
LSPERGQVEDHNGDRASHSRHATEERLHGPHRRRPSPARWAS